MNDKTSREQGHRLMINGIVGNNNFVFNFVILFNRIYTPPKMQKRTSNRRDTQDTQLSIILLCFDVP